MRKSLLLILFLVAGPLLAHYLLPDRGYVLINFRGVAYETSLPGLLLALALVYLLIRILIRVFRAPRKFGEAVSQQRQSRARRKLNRGLIEMAEGNWKKSESMLAQGAKAGDMPLLNYLNAARAAQLQGEHERRDNWLMLAYEQDEDASTAVLLTQAELQIAHSQYEESLATLRKIEESEPGQPQAQILLAKVYEQLQDWPSLANLALKLRKIKKSSSQAEVNRLLQVSALQQLDTAGAGKDLATIKSLWQSFTVNDRKQPQLIHRYASALNVSDNADEAETVLKKAIAANWDDNLVTLYGQVISSSLKKQLATAESWLANRGDDANLLIASARLALKAELVGKARSYLEAAIGMQPRADAYQLYGELLTQLGEADNASAAFRQGLALMTGGISSAPALTCPDAGS